ncbi:MAG: hypothetical protein AAGE01_12110 [Pseudomonadota bacterium]
MHRFTLLLLASLSFTPSGARDFLIESGDVAGLIAAIEAANTTPESDRVFLPAQSEYRFRTPAPGAATALPLIEGRLQIIGNGAVLRRYSAEAFAHLAVGPDGDLAMVDVVLADGGNGAIHNAGRLLAWGVTIEDSSARGGASALLNTGTARLLDCDVRFNSLAAADPTGGAIVNRGTLEIDDSRLVGNTAFGGTAPTEFGAALSNFGQATVSHSVISANGADAAFGRSGAIANFGEATLRLRDSVIEGNEPAALATVRLPGAIELSGTRIER